MLKPKKNHSPTPAKPGLHPRNPHGVRYDFPRLVACCPSLAAFLMPHPIEGETVDFADPAAVTMLNRALLQCYYGISHWDIPTGYLCPPVPGRADYLHHAADLLAEGDAIPRGPAVVVLDIGVGANCIYPIVGAHDYGWRFVGSEIDPVSVEAARGLVAKNAALAGRIEIRPQPSPRHIFQGVVRPGETFALSICNPPFHASAAEAAAGTLRKLRNLGGSSDKPVLNFGGQSNELWCDGGEAAFVQRMIAESATRRDVCVWFTTLVSKQGNLPAIDRALRTVKPNDVRLIERRYGQKKSRIVAWTFLTPAQRKQWRNTLAAQSRRESESSTC